jgi:ferredoxin
VKVTVDRDTCVGTASCVGIAPGVFELDEEYKSVVIDPAGADDEALRRAVEACPVQAISIEEDD